MLKQEPLLQKGISTTHLSCGLSAEFFSRSLKVPDALHTNLSSTEINATLQGQILQILEEKCLN